MTDPPTTSFAVPVADPAPGNARRRLHGFSFFLGAAFVLAGSFAVNSYHRYIDHERRIDIAADFAQRVNQEFAVNPQLKEVGAVAITNGKVLVIGRVTSEVAVEQVHDVLSRQWAQLPQPWSVSASILLPKGSAGIMFPSTSGLVTFSTSPTSQPSNQ